MTTRSSHSNEHLYPLDVLRFASAFAVMALHLCFADWAVRNAAVADAFGHAATYEPLAPWTWFGWVGVNIFFVISGFVIANSAAGATPAAFLKGRVLRLFPAVWVCATITIMVLIAFNHAPLGLVVGEYARTMVLWVRGPWIDGVYWSLAVEIVFYSLVFWVLVIKRVLTLERLPWLLLALTLFYQTLNANFELAEHMFGHEIVGKVYWWGGDLILKYSAYFAIGVWLWMMQQRTLKLADVVGLCLAVVLCVRDIYARSSTFQEETTYVMNYPAWLPIAVWFAGVAVVAAAALAPSRFAVRSPAWQRALKRIGLMTYPLFLVHSVAGAVLMRAGIERGMNPWLALALGIAGALLTAYVITVTAEVGIRALLRKWIEKGEHALERLPAFSWLFAPTRG